MEIFKLVGNIFVDNEKANKSIDKTDNKGKGLTKTFKKIGRGAKMMGKLVGAGALAGGAALGSLALKSVTVANEINKFAQVTGTTRKQYQQLDAVMKKANRTMEESAGDFAALGEKALDAANGVGEGAELFEELGISVTDASGAMKSQGDIFEETIESLQNMEDVTKRNALASALLGSTGEELVPILNMTNEEFSKMKDNAKVIPDGELDKAAEFKDAWENIKNTFGATAAEVGLKFVPVLTKLLTWVESNMPMIEMVFQKTFSAIGAAIDFVVPIIKTYLIPAFKAIGSWVMDNLPTIKKIFSDVFTVIAEIVKTFVDIVVAIWDKFGDHILKAASLVWDAIKDKIKVVLDAIKSFVDFWIAIFSGDWKEAWTQLKKFVGAIWTAIKDNIEMVITGIKNVVRVGFKAISGVAESIFSGLAGIVTGIWDGIVNGIKSSINVVIDLINGFIRKANKLNFDLPGVGNIGFNINQLSRLQVGGELVSDGPVMVGEAGPEILDLPEGARVIPLNKLPPEEKEESETQTITNEFNISGLVVREEADIEKIARELYNLQLETERGFGS